MNKLATVLLAVFSLFYPLLWYFGRDKGVFLWLAAAMAALWLLRAAMQKMPSQKIVSLLVAVFFVALLVWQNQAAMYWYPVLVNGLMLALFGGSLFTQQSLVERLARLTEPDLPSAAVLYTRRVTQIWCIFFIINGSIAAILYLANWLQAWAVYTGIVAYVLMGLLGGGEWLYRQYQRKKNP
ncbi:MAG: hypothetical protein Q4E16_07085 [Neisseria sp.]|nr:hypothetical protein [Neisseria sp.]